jgi:hypothetical protein
MIDSTTRPCDRPLSLAEAALLTELLTRSDADSTLIAQVPELRVIAESSSPWPIIEFSNRSGGVVADFFWSAGPALFGVHVLATSQVITCMECWSVNGIADPSRWPLSNELRESTA